MKFFINYRLGIMTEAEEKPEPITEHYRYGDEVMNWTEVTEEEYDKYYRLRWNLTVNNTYAY